MVAAVETEQAAVADAKAAVGDLAVLQRRLCYQPVGPDDIEELGAIIKRLGSGLEVTSRWMEWIRNGRHIYEEQDDVREYSTSS